MILVERTRDKQKMVLPPPFGPGFSPHAAAAAAVMEVHGSSLLDKGERCIFVLRGEDGRVLVETQVDGY